MDEMQKRVWDSAVRRDYLSRSFVSVFQGEDGGDGMDKRDRAMLVLRFAGRFSMQDIATQLKVSKKTVSLRLRRVLSRFGLECA